MRWGAIDEQAEQKAKTLLSRLNVGEHLWHLAPATFSGGEQQRVNIARGFIWDYPILLFDEPTASLDAKNSAVVVELIQEPSNEALPLWVFFMMKLTVAKLPTAYIT